MESRRSWFLLVYLGSVTGLLYAAFSSWAYDDPFITFRYAENLARGLGFVYNPGERILSTTTPLFTMLLASFYPLWSDVPHLANLIGAIGVGLGGLFLWDLAHSWKTEIAGWVALVLYPTFTLLLSTLGSELPLFLSLCLGAFAFYARQWYTLTAIFTALALLTRGDGLLIAILLVFDFLAQARRPIPWRSVLLFLLLTLPWFAFAWAYFGSPLPVTLAAKRAQGSMAISQRFAQGFLTVAQGHLAFWEFRLEAVLAAIGLVWAIVQRRSWLTFFAWTALYFVAYALLGVSRYFWYYAPLVPGFVAAVGLGIHALTEWLERVVAPYKEREDIHRFIFIAPWVVALILFLPLSLAQIQNVFELRDHGDRRYQIYREVGEWIGRNTLPSAVVGTLEVGIIGYYAGRQQATRSFIDFAGLLRPEIAAQFTPQSTYEDAAIWAVERYHPDILVLHARLFPRLEQGHVADQCQAVQRFQGASYGYSTDLVIYTCLSP